MKIALHYINDISGNTQAFQLPPTDWEKVLNNLKKYKQALKLKTGLKKAFGYRHAPLSLFSFTPFAGSLDAATIYCAMCILNSAVIAPKWMTSNGVFDADSAHAMATQQNNIYQ